MVCPRCGSTHIKKNGSIHNKKQKYQCNSCRRQFVENPQNKIIDDATKKRVDKHLLEKIPLAGIARVEEVSEPWVQQYANRKYAETPRVITVMGKPKGRLTIECDELWSFVGSKGEMMWVWLAIDLGTRECVGCFIGSRGHVGAQGLWDSLPPICFDKLSTSTGSVRLPIPITGPLMTKFFLRVGTVRSARNQEKPITSKG